MDEKAAIEEAVRCRLSLLRVLEDERLGRTLMLDQMGAFSEGAPPLTQAAVELADDLRAHYYLELLHAPSWPVDEEVTNTLEKAWEGYPTTTAYSSDLADLPSSGFVLLDHPIPDPSYGTSTMTHGIVWTVSTTGAAEFFRSPDDEPRPILTLLFLGRDIELGLEPGQLCRLYPYTTIAWQLDVEGGGRLWTNEGYNELAATKRTPFIKFFLSLIAIMRQRIAQAEKPREVPKKTADKLKFAKRKRPELNTDIRVVRFRKQSGSGVRTGTGKAGSKLKERTWTIPFWRWQWYRSTGENKPILIRPFLRGPEGAPIKGQEKVFMLPKPLGPKPTHR